MESRGRREAHVALKAIYEALAPSGEPASAWRRLAAALTLRTTDDGLISRSRVEETARSMRPGLAAVQLVAAAEQLGVLAGGGERVAYSPVAAEEVARALELAGDSLAAGSLPASWVPVGTIPEVLRRTIVVPELRQTAGVLLEIIDNARHEVWLTAPFIDRAGLGFLAAALISALERGVTVNFVVRLGTLESGVFADLVARGSHESLRGLRVFEVATGVSDLGSHAKVCLADGVICYIGSANLTAHGLGRHLELGARVQGPDVTVIRAALEAIAELGRLVYPVGQHRTIHAAGAEPHTLR